MAEKYRYGEVVLYPCNMVPNWKNVIEEKLQCAFAGCLHDRDDCEPHIHLIMVRGNGPATPKWFIKWCNSQLSNPEKFRIEKYIDKVTGEVLEKQVPVTCCSTFSPIIDSFQRAYDYLYHGGSVLDKCKNEGKFLYKQTDVFTGNNFDLHHYIQTDNYDKMIIAQKIGCWIRDHNIMDDITVFNYCLDKGDDFFQVYCSKHNMFSRLCAGNWKKWERDKQKNKDNT